MIAKRTGRAAAAAEAGARPPLGRNALAVLRHRYLRRDARGRVIERPTEAERDGLLGAIWDPEGRRLGATPLTARHAKRR